MRMNHDFAQAQRRRTPFTFICHGCDCVQHRPTPAPPEGWVTKEAADDLQIYCAECSTGEEPEAVEAQLRADNRAMAAMIPVAVIGFAAVWTILPA